LPEDSIAAAAKRMREKSVGCLVATVDGLVKGIITDRDLLACLEQDHDPYRCNIGTHMSRPVVVLRPDEDHLTAVEVLRRKQIKRLPIAADGKLVGIVSLSDLARLGGRELEELWPSWGFLTNLVRTAAVQGRSLKKAAKVEKNGPQKNAAQRAPSL
jgi:signal-transduction protein with cAMP-binding, CBS, and nucleotidyltransferase domain